MTKLLAKRIILLADYLNKALNPTVYGKF